MLVYCGPKAVVLDGVGDGPSSRKHVLERAERAALACALHLTSPPDLLALLLPAHFPPSVSDLSNLTHFSPAEARQHNPSVLALA